MAHWWFFSDSKTQTYINNAIAEYKMYAHDTQLEMAWFSLFQRREEKDPDGDDRELAAAEHYLYARWQVSSGKTWTEVMRIRALGYDVAKLLGYLPPILLVRKLAGHSWSRPSTDSLRWGLKGANDGEKDKHAITKDHW